MNAPTRPTYSLLTIALALLLAACGGGGGGDDANDPQAERPHIDRTWPSDGEEGVAPDYVIVDMEAALVPGSVGPDQVRLEGPMGPVAGNTSYDGSGPRMVFTPAAPLAPGTPFTARVLPGYEDLEGNVRQSEYRFSFVTEAPVFGPDFPTELEPDDAYLMANAHNGTTRAAYAFETRIDAETSEFHVGDIDDYQTWLPPELVSTNVRARIDKEQGLAVSAKKDTVLTWTREVDGQRDAWFRYEREGATWLAPRPLEESPDRETTEPIVAIDDEGHALIAWIEGDDNNTFNDVRVAWATSSGSLYGPYTVDASDANVGNLRLSLNSQGEGILSWAQHTSAHADVWACRFTLASFEPPEPLETHTTDHTRPAEVVMKEDGSAVVLLHLGRSDVWPGFSIPALTYFRAAASAWSTPVPQETTPRRYKTVRPVLDDAGNLTFAWYGGDINGVYRVSTRRLAADLSAAPRYDFPAVLTPWTFDMQLQGTPDGHLAIAWSGQPNGSPDQTLLAAVRPAGGSWTAPRILGSRSGDSDPVFFSLAANPGGGAQLVWTPDGESTTPRTLLYARRVRADGSIAETVPVGRELDGGSLLNALMVNQSGVGVAVWERFASGGQRDIWGATLR